MQTGGKQAVGGRQTPSVRGFGAYGYVGLTDKGVTQSRWDWGDGALIPRVAAGAATLGWDMQSRWDFS